MKPENEEWIFAAEESRLREGSLHPVFPKGLAILLIKKEGRVYAVSNKCAHMACGLSAGALKEYAVQCPCHDWRFDIRTGEFLNAREIKIPTYRLRAEGGKIFIHIEEGGRS